MKAPTPTSKQIWLYKKLRKIAEPYHAYTDQLMAIAIYMDAELNNIKRASETEKCPTCGGSGTIKDGKYSEDCMKCYGSGQILINP